MALLHLTVFNMHQIYYYIRGQINQTQPPHRRKWQRTNVPCQTHRPTHTNEPALPWCCVWCPVTWCILRVRNTALWLMATWKQANRSNKKKKKKKLPVSLGTHTGTRVECLRWCRSCPSSWRPRCLCCPASQTWSSAQDQPHVQTAIHLS